MIIIRKIIRKIRKWNSLKIISKKNRTCQIYESVSIDNSSELGEYVVLFKGVILGETRIGSYSYIQSNTTVFNCEIGKFCSIAGNVTIGLANHPTNMVSTHPSFFDDTQPLPKFFIEGRKFINTLPRTIIGSDVWIGQSVMIKAGVKIGTGAVIGAGSVVVKDVPSYAIVGGVPARVIRYRFDEQIRTELLKSEWWNMESTKLTKYAEKFDDPEMFLD